MMSDYKFMKLLKDKKVLMHISILKRVHISCI